MLSGLQDEVVPCEHMQGLWEIVKRREASVSVDTSPQKQSDVAVRSDKSHTSESTTKESRKTGITAYVEDTKTLSKYIEFADGAHSKQLAKLLKSYLTSLTTDDTCVQPGYWSAVAEFIASIVKADHYV
jgi:abhydrolase domain-containing protein 13